MPHFELGPHSQLCASCHYGTSPKMSTYSELIYSYYGQNKKLAPNFLFYIEKLFFLSLADMAWHVWTDMEDMCHILTKNPLCHVCHVPSHPPITCSYCSLSSILLFLRGPHFSSLYKFMSFRNRGFPYGTHLEVIWLQTPGTILCILEVWGLVNLHVVLTSKSTAVVDVALFLALDTLEEQLHINLWALCTPN